MGCNKEMVPYEVAEALIFFKEHGLEKVLMYSHWNTSETFGGTLYSWCEEIGDNDRHILARAYLNGFVVEEPKTFTTNRTLDVSEIKAIRNWYKNALLRIENGEDEKDFAKEAIEEVALYLGGAELLKDLSRFCEHQLQRENAKSG
jgi:hypothetical protein